MPIVRSWALTRGFALHPGTRNRYKIRYTRNQDRPSSLRVNAHDRVFGTHTLGGASALSESMKASFATLGGASALSESMKASFALTKSMRATLEDLPTVARIAGCGFTKDSLRYTAHRIDLVLPEDVLDETSSYEGRADVVETRRQQSDRSDPLIQDAADTEGLPVLMVLVPFPPALVDAVVTAVAPILQHYWFTLRILGAVAEVDPAIAGLSLLITAAGVMSWLLVLVDRQ